MRQIVTPQQMRLVEERAIRSGITQEELMNRAGIACAHSISSHLKENQPILVVCGKGNNGGDGYRTAQELLRQGRHITVWQIPSNTPTPLLLLQKNRFQQMGGTIIELDDGALPSIPDNAYIIDAIFGIGFQGAPEGIVSRVIQAINHSGCSIISIDIPSGLDAETGKIPGVAIHAHFVLAIEHAKLGFFLRDGWNVSGTILCLPIGLAPYGSESVASCVEISDLPPLLPRIIRNRHKYQTGHVVGIAGSSGMMGAALLASYASLRAGCGICHLLYPEEALHERGSHYLEVIARTYPKTDLTAVIEWMKKADACFIGPGMGATANDIMKVIWPHLTMKTVVDADALNWLSHNISSCGLLPHAILTPHTGEVSRLLAYSSTQPISFELLQQCQKFVDDHKTHLVLKGGPSFLFSHDTKVCVMPFGDPGMATAGAGDVLTGILAALLAQGLSPHDAMTLGSSLHGLAGMQAACAESSYCITASSLLEYLPQTFLSIQEQIGHFSTT